MNSRHRTGQKYVKDVRNISYKKAYSVRWGIHKKFWWIISCLVSARILDMESKVFRLRTNQDASYGLGRFFRPWSKPCTDFCSEDNIANFELCYDGVESRWRIACCVRHIEGYWTGMYCSLCTIPTHSVNKRFMTAQGPRFCHSLWVNIQSWLCYGNSKNPVIVQPHWSTYFDFRYYDVGSFDDEFPAFKSSVHSVSHFLPRIWYTLILWNCVYR